MYLLSNIDILAIHVSITLVVGGAINLSVLHHNFGKNKSDFRQGHSQKFKYSCP